MAKKKKLVSRLKMLPLILLAGVFIGIVSMFVFRVFSKPTILWKYHNPNLVGKTQIIYRDKIYVETIDGNVIAVGLKNGREAWKTHVGNIKYTDLPSIVGNSLQIHSPVGKVVSVDITTGKIVSYTNQEHINPNYSDTVTIQNKRYEVRCTAIIDGCASELSAYNNGFGIKLWTWPTIVNNPLLTDGSAIYFTSGDSLYSVK